MRTKHTCLFLEENVSIRGDAFSLYAAMLLGIINLVCNEPYLTSAVFLRRG